MDVDSCGAIRVGPPIAQVAELVDAQVSGTCGRMVVEVRVFSWAPSSDWLTTLEDLQQTMSDTLNNSNPIIKLHRGDLPDGLTFGSSVAVDTETLGLNPLRDRLCLVQLSAGNSEAHLVQFDGLSYDAPNLKQLLSDPGVTKIFHYARFDVAVIQHYMDLTCAPIFCTKIASRLTRTYTDRHGLRDLCGELLGIELSKLQQQSDWGTENLSQEQMQYAALDVLYLHGLKEILERRLSREGRHHLAHASFNFLPTRVELDLSGWAEQDIFSHS